LRNKRGNLFKTKKEISNKEEEEDKLLINK